LPCVEVKVSKPAQPSQPGGNVSHPSQPSQPGKPAQKKSNVLVYVGIGVALAAIAFALLRRA